ncbi:MAG TPA: glycosyltransferase family 1 protein [Actinomycetales bacterium]
MLLLRGEGVISLAIHLLSALQRLTRRRGRSQKQRVDVVARYDDILAADPATPPPAWPGTDAARLQISWIMPPPGRGSGGHMTLFRFIKAAEDAGHSCTIYLYTAAPHGSIAAVREDMGTSFPALDAQMVWLDSPADFTGADAVVATSWETAYASYRLPSSARRFYFVQDFEPFFYPVGSLSALAENTYRFGFRGITAGAWLAGRLQDEYGMAADHFDFGSDPGVYPCSNAGPRREVAFYVRLTTERRGFEMGLMAMDLFHRRHPDYTISLFGWDVAGYEIPFPYVNRGTLDVSELGALYNRCAAVLVLSFTNMSLLPLELLSAGAIPVVNDAPNNRMVSDNPHIAYAAGDPVSLAGALSEVVSRPDLVTYARTASDSVQGASWEESGAAVVGILERETRRRSDG